MAHQHQSKIIGHDRQQLHSLSYNSVHCLNQIVDEVLSVAMVATLNVVQPLLVHATLKQQARSVHSVPSKENSKQCMQV